MAFTDIVLTASNRHAARRQRSVVINAAADVTFLVAGAEKAPRLREVLEQGSSDGPPVPAQLVKPVRGALHWMVDAAAGAELDGHR